jgi:hypothetical protein
MSFEKEIETAKSIDDVFKAVQKHYMTELPLSFVKLVALKAGLKSAIKTIQPPPR